MGGDALSGLARAFFYAGSRALLVSHWPVDSDATVALITNAFDAYKADNKTGRAEALRRAMTALIKTGGRSAHPSYWAPFVVVGEGAR
jgi:CHAT domain-containing protein